MARISIKIDSRRMVERLQDMLHQLQNTEELWRNVSQYMVRSTRNRIYQQRRSPDGSPWAALAEATIESKGHDRPLVHTGTLAETIEAVNITRHGFSIRAPAEDERGHRYASFMQKGFKHSRSKKRVPARPFLGFSAENNKRIAKMIRDHLMNQ